MYINSLKTFFPSKLHELVYLVYFSLIITPQISSLTTRHSNQLAPFRDLTGFSILGVRNPHLICLFATLTLENPSLIHEMLPLLRLSPLSSCLFCYVLLHLNYPSQLLSHYIITMGTVFFSWGLLLLIPIHSSRNTNPLLDSQPLAHAPDLF